MEVFISKYSVNINSLPRSRSTLGHRKVTHWKILCLSCGTVLVPFMSMSVLGKSCKFDWHMSLEMMNLCGLKRSCPLSPRIFGRITWWCKWRICYISKKLINVWKYAAEKITVARLLKLTSIFRSYHFDRKDLLGSQPALVTQLLLKRPRLPAPKTSVLFPYLTLGMELPRTILQGSWEIFAVEHLSLIPNVGMHQ